MASVAKGECSYEGHSKRPSFRSRGYKAGFCSRHAGAGVVNVVHEQRGDVC